MSATVKTIVNQPYKYGFITDIEADIIPRGMKTLSA
jgi:Fe-S cluster assembly protein SufB